MNGAVGRFTATPDALTYLDRYYVPTGALDVPTVTLHTTRDPLVPYFHEREFAAAVDGQGSAGRLLQRSVEPYGHCAFSTAEMMNAFQSLAGWVATGQKPAN